MAWLFRRFRGTCPFSHHHSSRFRKPPSHPGRSAFPSPVGSSSFPWRTFPRTPRLKHSPAYPPWVHSYNSSSTLLGSTTALSGTASRRWSQLMPATYREPLCPPRVLLGTGRGQPRLGRRYPPLFAHIGSCAPPKPSRRLSSRLYDESLQVAASLLLGVGGSRRCLHNPCIGAWPLTPPRFLSASTRFFLRNIGLTNEVSRSAREITSIQCNFNMGGLLGAAGISLCSGSYARLAPRLHPPQWL